MSLIMNPWFLTQFPAFILAVLLALFPQGHKLLIQIAGYSAVAALAIVLSLNPLIKIFKSVVWLKKLNRYRREIGVACFTFALVHIACFVVKHGIPKVFKFVKHPSLIPAIFIAFPIFLIMTLTSNNWSIKKLGFQKWKKIHNTVYIAEAAIFIHMFMVGKKLYAFLIFIPLVLLQLLRKHLSSQPTAASSAR